MTKRNTEYRFRIGAPLLRPGMTLESGPISEGYLFEEGQKLLNAARALNTAEAVRAANLCDAAEPLDEPGVQRIMVQPGELSALIRNARGGNAGPPALIVLIRRTLQNALTERSRKHRQFCSPYLQALAEVIDFFEPEEDE